MITIEQFKTKYPEFYTEIQSALAQTTMRSEDIQAALNWYDVEQERITAHFEEVKQGIEAEYMNNLKTLSREVKKAFAFEEIAENQQKNEGAESILQTMQ